MEGYTFIDDNGSFKLTHAERYRNLYFPLAGENGLKSFITPGLSGDAKLDQNMFLLKPQSIEDIKDSRSLRNFWVLVNGEKPWSVSGNSPYQIERNLTDEAEEVTIEAGFMWHRMTRSSKERCLIAEVTSFIPFDANTEVHLIKITNTSKITKEMSFLPAVPIYGRSADNLRDHRHVTSLLNRITVTEYGIVNKPTLSFDERGHKENDAVYIVEGFDKTGNLPIGFYPDFDEFVGDAGDAEWPMTVVKRAIKGQKADIPGCPGSGRGTDEAKAPGYSAAGREAMGAFEFAEKEVKPGESIEFVVLAGVVTNEDLWPVIRERLNTYEKAACELNRTRNYWLGKMNINIETGDKERDGILKWIGFQPELRRIFGCSFLPHHDYGRGGRGWRDLWQDCLALLLMNPSSVRQMLHGNFAGVRLDGTNATIIGEKQGQFKADRNSITRVWMDHGVWPWVTTGLYLDRTGDIDFLFDESPYFEDGQVLRGRHKKETSNKDLVHLLKTGEILKSTNLEHLLIETLTAFWEVGEHNLLLLKDADWNDALDLASDRGESVAFSAAYAGNLISMADMLASSGISKRKIVLLKDTFMLLSSGDNLYESPERKRKLLEEYCEVVANPVAGEFMKIDAIELSENLREKGEWLLNRIRTHEWREKGGEGWFISYYDNDGKPLDDAAEEDPMMMLTGQVFTVSSGTATDEQIKKLTKAADRRLYDKAYGGYRLNTDFNEVKMNMGRMFGFAYGEKENGAVFSHMAVMYANALYKRGYADEGHKALESLLDASKDFETSRIYPGIPEYFGFSGRGLYHYLTGAASWFFLTVIEEVFGVCGNLGDLKIAPKLDKSWFDQNGKASMDFSFEGVLFKLELSNDYQKDYADRELAAARLDGEDISTDKNAVIIPRSVLEDLDTDRRHRIEMIYE